MKSKWLILLVIFFTFGCSQTLINVPDDFRGKVTVDECPDQQCPDEEGAERVPYVGPHPPPPTSEMDFRDLLARTGRTGSRRSTIRVYGTTGGAAGDLDGIECEDIRGDDAATTDPLRDDDVAWGIITTAGAHPQIYFWAFDEDVDETNCTGANEPWDFCTGAGTGTFAEDDPRLIIPDDSADCTVTASEGAWILGETYYLGRVATPSQVFRDADAADTDDNVKVYAECSDPGSTTEDCDYFIQVQIAGTLTTVLTIDADGSITSALPHIATTSYTIGSAAMSEVDLEKLDGITNGTQAANKAVVADANVNTGVSKVTELHIGASGSEVQVTSTGTELNLLDTVTTTATQFNYLNAATGTTGTTSTNVVFSTSPTLVTPVLGTISSGVGTALTALNGENIQNDTIDDDSIDFTDVTAEDITHTGMTVAIATTGTISGGSLTPVADDCDNFAANFTGTNLYGGTFICNAAGTCVLPAISAGYNFTIITLGAIACVIDPNASDLMITDGVAGADGENATNASTAGDIAVVQYYDATGWLVTTNGWTPE